MATDLESLVLSISADTRMLTRGLKRMEGDTGRTFKRIDGQAKAMSTRVNTAFATMAASIKGGLVGLAAGLTAGGIGGVFSGIRTSISEIAQVASEAKRAGVGVEVFQELSYAAGQSLVSLDALTDGLKEMQLRADEFIVTGKGSAAEAFQRLGYTADELKAKLKDPAALFEEIIAKLGRLDVAARIRIADELFGGTGGEQFVKFLDRGADAIGKARQEARDMGAVLSKEGVDKAIEINRAFDQMALTMKTNVREAVLNVLSLLREFPGAIGNALKPMADAPKVALQKTNDEIDRLQTKMAGLKETGATAFIGDFEKQLAAAQSRRDALSEMAREASRAGAWSGQPAPAAGAVQGPPMPPGMGAPTPPSAPGTGGASAAAVVDGYQAIHREALARIASLDTERQALGLTTAQSATMRFEQKLLAQAMKDGTALTQTQRDELAQLAAKFGVAAQSMEAAKEAQERFNETMDAFKDTTRDALGTFIRDMKDGASATDALSSALDRVADRFLDKSLDSLVNGLFSGVSGSGGLGSLFQPFGAKGFSALPKFNTGGVVPGSGPVPIMAHGGETIFNPPQMRELTRRNSGPTNVTIKIDVTGARGNAEIEAMVANGVSQGMQAVMKAVPRVAVESVRAQRGGRAVR